MTANAKELNIIDALSKRIVEAQKNLRILDCIKWDDAVCEEFFRQGAREMPPVDAEYYRQHPLPFDSVQKMDEFRGIIRDAENQLGQYAAVSRLIKRQCQEYVKAVRMLDARGTPLFSELSTELYGSPDDVFYAGGPKLSLMGTVLFDLLTQLDGELQSEADIKKYTPEDARSKLQTALSHYFDKHRDAVTVIVSDGMIADASAGADTRCGRCRCSRGLRHASCRSRLHSGSPGPRRPQVPGHRSPSWNRQHAASSGLACHSTGRIPICRLLFHGV
jgi:hypothetical protein